MEDADPDQRAQVAGGPADRSLSEKTAGEDGGEGGRHTASSSRDAGKTKTEEKMQFLSQVCRLMYSRWQDNMNCKR